MPPCQTSLRLIDAAQACFAEQGYQGASLRSITERAGANLAAVSYHFGGKEGLLDAVVARAVDPINAERRRRFDELEAAGDDGLEAWVRAMIEPCFAYHDPERFAVFFGLMARIHLESPAELAPIFERHFKAILERFRAALTRALPGVEPRRLFLRLQLAGGAFGKCMMLFGHEQVPPVMPGARPEPAMACEELVRFMIGGLSAGEQP